MLWRFDAEYKGLRREVPWLRRLPSEYFADHVWVTTQPLELSASREQIVAALSWFGGEDKLVFSSDYPHWDADDLAHLRQRLPESWHARFFRENALRLLRVEIFRPAGREDGERHELDVGAVDDFPDRSVTLVRAGSREIGIVRWDDAVYAVSATSARTSAGRSAAAPSGLGRSTAAAPGELELDDDTPVLACPWHGWEFDVRTGRALWDDRYAVRTFGTRVENGRVLVELKGRSA